jgi:protocatechuate 4,5-dioxygenase alpha chain
MSGNWRQLMPSIPAYWMGRILYDIHHKPADLERYRADPAAYVAAFPLSDALKLAIVENDIGAMFLAGVNPYLLRQHCLGLHIPDDVFTGSLAAVRKEAALG